MPCRLKGAGLPINPKDNNTIAALIGDDAEFAGRVNIEVARRSNPGALVLHERECPLGQIDPVNRDAVVPPI